MFYMCRYEVVSALRMSRSELADRIRTRGGMCPSLRWSSRESKWTHHQSWQTKRTLLDYYVRAIQLLEGEKMPEAGYCMDRRALRHVATFCADDRVHSLICFVCAQIHTCCVGVGADSMELSASRDDLWQHHWYPPAAKQVSEIRY